MKQDLSNIDYSQYIEKKAQENAERRKRTDKVVKVSFALVAFLCVGIVLTTLIFLLYSGITPFFREYQSPSGDATGRMDLWRFLTGTSWSINDFQYGIGWVIVNTIYLTLISVLISAPIGVLTALFIVRIAPPWLGNILNVFVTILAGIPSVIVGLFGVGVIMGMIRWMTNGGANGGSTVFAAVLVLALMALPTICTMSITAFKALDKRLAMASLALGATPTQTNFKLLLSAAQSGIFASIILGTGRAIGEATAVQMVTGAISGPTFGLFDNTATLTSVMLTGLGEARPGSLNYDARFSAGLVLMAIILITNLSLNALRQHIYNKANGVVKPKRKFFAKLKKSS